VARRGQEDNTEVAADDETVVEGETTTEEKAAKKSKIPMPEGKVTPVEFGHKLKELRDVEIRPQVIYGYVKNNKAFQAFTDQHDDGRVRVDLEQALTWWDEKEARKAEKAAAPAETAEATA
jgi:hypothetical protein